MNRISAQPNLFGEAGPVGLTQAGEFVSPDEERVLIASIDAVELSSLPLSWMAGEAPYCLLRLAL